MPDSNINIKINGETYDAWTSARIEQSLETLTNSFSLTIATSVSKDLKSDWNLKIGDSCQIYIDDDILIDGYINNLTPSINATSYGINVNGRGKTSDLIDCSYIESPKSWKEISFKSLAIALAKPFSIGVKVSKNVDSATVNQKFPFTVNTNNSAFDNLNLKAKEYGLLLTENSEGKLVIENSANIVTQDNLEYGVNILEASINYSDSERYSRYIVQAQSLKKQNIDNWTKQIGIQAEALDSEISRYRPKLIKSSSPLTVEMAQKEANWEALVRAGKSQELNVTVQGFRQSGNSLWKVNQLCDVLIPPLFIDPITQLLIVNVLFELSSSGSTTKLKLKRPDAFMKKPIKKVSKKDNMGW